MSPQDFFFSSESVTAGHPDKICDMISDAVLDACLSNDATSRVACECATNTGFVLVMGEITTKANVDYREVARKTICDIGYNKPEYQFDGSTCGILIALDKQSEDISCGVTTSWEVRNGTAKDKYDEIGAGDQGLMFGYACNQTEELMPLPIVLAHKLTRKMAEVLHVLKEPWIRPDGKSQVCVYYNSRNQPAGIKSILVSTHHSEDIDNKTLEKKIKELVIYPTMPADLLNGTEIMVNPSGRFCKGGPAADSGVTGRKIIVDTYGGWARHGGGCFSGKDPTKVDRSAAYAARWAAKNIVAAGLADECEIQIAYAIGRAHPMSIRVNTFGTEKVPIENITEIVQHKTKIFDFRPAAIIEKLDLLKPIYRQTASYGHFGRSDLDLPWEMTNKVEEIQNALGFKVKA